jgi:hypothetical protein
LQKGANVKRQLLSLGKFSGSLSAKVHFVLEDAILCLANRMVENMRKREICDAMGVLRSPVCQAIARLQTKAWSMWCRRRASTNVHLLLPKLDEKIVC